MSNSCSNEECDNPLCDCDVCECTENDPCPCCVSTPE